MLFDVAVVGAGVIGTLIARELSKYKLAVALLEKENDVAMGTTKANSAIVHAGFDAKPGSLKAKLNVEGNRLMKKVCSELSVPLKSIGSLVVAFSPKEREVLDELLQRGIENGVEEMEIVEGERLFELEPNLSREAVAALYAGTAAIVCPYELSIAAAENAVVNAAALLRNFEVASISRGDKAFTLTSSDGNELQAKYIINAAGVFADKIAALAGDESISITARKGEYFLLDKSCAGTVRHVVFQCPSDGGKGALLAPTVDNNIIVGPASQDSDDKDDLSTTADGAEKLVRLSRKSVPDVPLRSVITSFAGLRAVGTTGDFIIGESETVKGLINVAGIESPGLSAAPAIAEYVRELLFAAGAEAEENKDFNAHREPPVRFRELSDEQRRELIARNSAYGRIVCRCETVTEGEIIDAIRAPAGARDIDAVKRRTRAGMGRCQGGFCGSKVMEILARELSLPLDEITKFGGDSKMLFGKTKETD